MLFAGNSGAWGLTRLIWGIPVEVWTPSPWRATTGSGATPVTTPGSSDPASRGGYAYSGRLQRHPGSVSETLYAVTTAALGGRLNGTSHPCGLSVCPVSLSF